MTSNPCTDPDLALAPMGTVMSYMVPPGLADLPKGWKLFGHDYMSVFPDGDEIEGINHYQPDIYRVVMIVKT